MTYPPQGKAKLLYDATVIDGAGTDVSPIGQKVWCETVNILAGEDATLLSATITCAQATVILAVWGGPTCVSAATAIKERLFIDGVQVSESGYLYFTANNWVGGGHGDRKSVESGNRVIELQAHNYSGAAVDVWNCQFLFGGCLKI